MIIPSFTSPSMRNLEAGCRWVVVGKSCEKVVEKAPMGKEDWAQCSASLSNIRNAFKLCGREVWQTSFLLMLVVARQFIPLALAKRDGRTKKMSDYFAFAEDNNCANFCLRLISESCGYTDNFENVDRCGALGKFVDA